ncbi:FIVAR domain-containing protein, partial [Mycoplasmopsis pullorum]
IESIKEIANALNDLMSKLNDYIENVVESANNVDPRTSVNYINADQELKDNFDTSYANATTLVDKELGANLNFDETNDVYLKLKKDFEALNGEQNKRLNAAELEKLVNEASEFVQKAPYTTSTSEKQNAYNVAIGDGKKVLENLENVTVEEIQEAIDKIKDAIKQIYDNKDDLKNIVDELPNLSEQEKERFKELIQNEEDPAKRDEILREAQKISDQKQELINLINEQPNLSDADKEQLRDKVVNANSSQENWYDKLKDDINKANELIKKLVDEIINHTLNNEQLDQLIKDLADAGVTNPDYDKIVDGLKKYNDLTKALTNYRNSHVLDENYQDLKDALVAAIKDSVDFAVTHEELSKLKDQLVSQKEQLNKVANGEMNLVDSLINKDQSKFDKALNSITQIISDKYSEFDKELSDKNYFEITNKTASQISENDINLINSIEQKDASKVIYSALQEALKTKSKADNLSIFWWILLGLLTAGIGPSIYFLAKKLKKDEE